LGKRPQLIDVHFEQASLRHRSKAKHPLGMIETQPRALPSCDHDDPQLPGFERLIGGGVGGLSGESIP
jgi:hypothetical protein